MNQSIFISFTFLIITAVCFQIQCTEAKIKPILVPEDIQTIGSLIYSILPPIKIGKDTRFGFGFRLGRNADVQFLIELGPQLHTAPLVSRRDRHTQEMDLHPSSIINKMGMIKMANK